MPWPLTIGPVGLSAAPQVTVARPVLGLTLYLAEPVVWASEGAAALLKAFLHRVPVGGLRWYTTSRIADWHRVDAQSLPEINRAVSYWTLGRLRHLFQLRLADDTGAPAYGFTYREVNEKLSPRAGYIDVSFPPDQNPQLLVELAVEAAQKWPLFCAIGGYAAAWNFFEKPSAFWQVYEWCRRYLGLDVQDPDAMAWHVSSGLPGTSWLNLIGNLLADRARLDLRKLAAGPWKNGIEATSLPGGLLLRAGPAPTLADVNQLDFPWAYAEVARALAGCLVKEPTELWGGFYDKRATAKWMRRFLEPEGWQ